MLLGFVNEMTLYSEQVFFAWLPQNTAIQTSKFKINCDRQVLIDLIILY